MYELYYGLHKRQKISDIVYTFMAAALVNGCGEMTEGSFTVDPCLFPKDIVKLFKKIKLNKKTKIDWEDISILNNYFLFDLKQHRFMVKVPFLGVCKTVRFKKYIRKNKTDSNKYIIKYIDSGDRRFLDFVDKRLNEFLLIFPSSDVFDSYYKDSADMFDSAMAARWGTINLDRYNYFYTKSKEKKSNITDGK